ncbi:MAG: hypothetical protein IPM29_07835 [Planctomycetes bacterium]|nr:hypothetical protein [Planctomycetota bacterium]
MSARPTRSRFHWRDTRSICAELATLWDLQPDGRGRYVADDPTHGGSGLLLRPPACLPCPGAGEPLGDWLGRLPATPGSEWVVLLQAGAAALGAWRADAELETKVFKRYVVRGHGRAQPTHLKTRGKSRYGSRLRLQMARKLRDEVCERLCAWACELGPCDVIHRACGDPAWAELWDADPPPPFAADDDRIRRIALTVRVPGSDELHRVRDTLRHGSVERLDAT